MRKKRPFFNRFSTVVPLPAEMNETIFKRRWGHVDTDKLPHDEYLKFKEDAFQLYEQSGFLKVFDSPYDDSGHNGMKFKVVRRAIPYNSDAKNPADLGEVDLEAMPAWLVEFENGDVGYCYPEEIAVLEHTGKTPSSTSSVRFTKKQPQG